MRVRRTMERVVATLALMLVGMTATSGPAHAETDSLESPDYDTEAHKHIKLDGPQPPPGLPRPPLPPPPPPLCWWSPTDGNYGDPKVFAEKYRAQAEDRGADMAEREFMKLPNGDESLEAAQRVEGARWYFLEWDLSRIDGGTDLYEELAAAGCTTSRPWRDGSQVAVLYNFFRTNEVPPPKVDVKDLALYAYRALWLVPPALEWNPKIATRGGAALVNLPTWFWVEDPLALQDEREITARIGDVWARVVARPGGMKIESPVGTVSCTKAQGRFRYAAGRDESKACTQRFPRTPPGPAGTFAVTATTEWSARWTSSTGEAETLPVRTVSETTNVPVVSSQALVTQVD